MPQGNEIVARLRLECAAQCQEIAALHDQVARMCEEMARPDQAAEAREAARSWRVRAMAHRAGVTPVPLAPLAS